MFGAVKLVLALCLVTQLRRARCQSGGADPPHPQCDELTLTLKVYSRRYGLLYNSEVNKNNKIAVEYEEQLELSCNGLPTPRLALIKDGEKLLPMNDTRRIYVSVEILDLQKSEYVCSDVETGCQLSVVISGTPLLKVTSNSDSIRFRLDYTIEYGDSVTVSCSTPDASRSVMTKDGEELITQEVSENTIEYFSSQQDHLLSKYVCTDLDTAADSSVLIKQMPLLYVQQGNQTLKRYKEFDIESQRFQTVAYPYYDDTIEVICWGWGPRTMDLIGLEDDNNEIVKGNVTTLKALVSKIKVKEMVFSCIDSEDPSSNSTVYVRAMPRMDVISPNVRRIEREYAVKYGDPVEIVCSWIDSINLTVSGEGTKIRTVQTNNKTTVTYHTYVNVLDALGFICSTGENSVLEEAYVQLLPEAIDLRCVLQEYLNCLWKASSYLVKYTLYYIEDGDFTIMCIQQSSRTSKGIGLCIWQFWHYQGYTTVLSFLMQSCSDFGCYNQTFLIDRESIIKLAPPRQLRVRRTSSRGAELSWYKWDPESAVLHKVVYWYSGINPREVNASLVSCGYWSYCKINLTLPCASMNYEVKVYRKLKTAIGEQYWSDPSTVTFVTDDDNNKANVLDSTCNWKPKKTKEVMVYNTQNLRYEVETEMPWLKRKVVPLRDKLAYIRELQEQLAEE